MIDNMTAFIFKAIIILVLARFKTDHLVKFSIVHRFCHDLVRM